MCRVSALVDESGVPHRIDSHLNEVLCRGYDGRMRPHVIILGCGFGGLFAARALRGVPLEVTVVDRVNHHLFTPLLYQVATAGLSAPAIAAPIRHILADQRNTTVLLGEVTSIDVANKKVILEEKSELPYDRLLVATGTIHNYFGNDAWAPFAPG